MLHEDEISSNLFTYFAAKLKTGRFPYLEAEARQVSLYGTVPCTHLAHSLGLISCPSIFYSLTQCDHPGQKGMTLRSVLFLFSLLIGRLHPKQSNPDVFGKDAKSMKSFYFNQKVGNGTENDLFVVVFSSFGGYIVTLAMQI